MRPISCPSEEELLAFHLGTLPDRDVDRVTDHLETCSHCEAAIQRFDDATDPVLSALRKPVPASSSLFSKSGRYTVPGPDLMAQENWPNLPGYEILAALGRGGMGVVYAARHLKLNRLVALKRFRSDANRELARSRIEAEALSRLQHPNIVQIYEIIEHENEIVLALELVEDGPISTKLKGKPQPPQETAELLETVARAVHFAHTQGIIHRDLKPANILHYGFNRSARGFGIPKITDFGVAKRLAVDSGETREGDVIGTPAYMSPEQASGKLEGVGPATDIYSLGVILYEMLTGRVPLQGPTTLDTLILVRNEEPVPPRQLMPRLPRDLETICLKCLAKEPARRYASAEALADDLRRYLNGEPILARPTPVWERAWKLGKRRPIVTILTAALVFVTVLGFSLVAWQWQRAAATASNEAQARKEAQDNEQREKKARLQLERLSAAMSINEGVIQCEGGEVGRGLLWLVRALERADRAGDADLERVARFNLASWQPYFIRPRALCLPAHKSWVWTVAISPDNRIGLTSSIDYTAQLWDLATGRPRGKPLEHKHPVWTAVFSPDGRKVLTGSRDYPDGKTSEALLWDVATGKPLLPPLPMSGDIALAAFTHDGKSFLLVCEDEARIWSTADGQPIGPPIKHPLATSPRPNQGPIQSAALSPDGKTLATGGEDATLRFWDTATGTARGEPLQAAGPVTALAYSPDGRTLVSGCAKGEVQLWDIEKGLQRGSTLHNSGLVMTIAFSRDSEMVATGGIVIEADPTTGTRRNVGGEVRIWQTATGNIVGSALRHPDDVRSLAFSREGRLLLTGCCDVHARFFAVTTGTEIGKPLRHAGTVTSVTVSPDGKTAFTSSAGGGPYQPAQLWDVPPEWAFGRTLLQPSQVRALAFSLDGRLLVSGGEDQIARLWDANNGQLVASLPPAEGRVDLVTFSPDHKSFLTCNNVSWDVNTGKSITRLWDLETRTVRKEIRFDGWMAAVAFSPDGRTVLLSPRGSKLLIWEPDTSRVTATEEPRNEAFFSSLEFSRDGQTLLGGDHGGVRLWNWNTHQLQRDWKEAGDMALLFPEGNKVMSMRSGHGRIWDIATDRELPPAPFQPAGGISHATFSPDGQMILTRGPDGIVRLWDVVTGKPLGPPLAREARTPIAFSPDGRHIAAASQHGQIALWGVLRPLVGDVERLRVWIEGLTGMELDDEDAIHQLSPDVLEQRRQRLEELGGPPPILQSKR